MNTEMDKKEFVIGADNTYQSEIKLQGQLAESTGDFVLPDYMPEMQKILRLEAKVLPPTRYIGANNVQMSGDVLHTLIYLGEDGETGATVLPSKYEFSVPTDTLDTNDVYASVELDGLNYRLTAPRKLNIRTRLNVKPYCYKNEDIGAAVIPADAKINKLYTELCGLKTVVLTSTDAEISDTVELGGAKNSKLLWCGATAAVNDARTMDGGVSVRGDVLAKILLEDDGEIKPYYKKIPFEEFIDGEVSRTSIAGALAHVVSTEAVKESENEASVEVGLFIEAIVDAPCKLSVMKDAFSVEREVKREYKTVNEARLVMSKNTLYNVGASIPKKEASMPDDCEITDTSGRAVIEETLISNGRIKMLGKCILTSIFNVDGETMSSQYSVPFEISTECDASPKAEVSCLVSLFNCRVRAEKEMLVCDMEIAARIRAVDQSKKEILSTVDCSDTEKYAVCKYPICMIYPSGESLWELAKKYHVSPESLARVNSLDIGEKDYTNKNALSKTKVLMLELK